ncbi:MAG: hypothetical protein ACLQEQ_09575 [Nitrososphaerales archaeon]
MAVVHSTSFEESAPIRHATKDPARNDHSPKGGPDSRRNDATRVKRRFRGPSKLSIAFLLVALVVALLLYVGTPPPASTAVGDANAQYRFAWVYSEVLIDEVLVLLAVVVLLVPLVNQRSDSFLRRQVKLARPVRVLAMTALVVGFLLFAFWVVIDLLGGYNGPGSVAIYKDIGLNHLALWDRQGVIGFLSFFVSVFGFMALRAERGIGTALRDGVSLFAAPILAVFELALWSDVPLDMYWHVTTFASLSLGSYLTPDQFSSMMNTGYVFTWTGNVYLLSNWLVLVASFLLFLIAVLYRLNPKRTRVIRRRR